MFTTEATGVIANAGLGLAGIGAPTSVVSDDAAIGGWPMVIGISTISRWRGRQTSFQISNMQIRRSNKSRRRRPAANMHLRLLAAANMRLRVRPLLLRRQAKGLSAAQWEALSSAAFSAAF